MLKTVLDTTILVSAFLRPNPGGASFDLLRFVRTGAVDLYLSNEILEETADVLLNRKHLRRRYAYADADVVIFCQELARLGTVVGDLPQISAVRDPNDDMIIATAVVAGALL